MASVGSHIGANLTKSIYTGLGSHVPVNLGYIIDCDESWRPVPGDQVDFASWKIPWLHVNGDEVDFNFRCEPAPVICTTLWQDYQGIIVPIAFKKLWQDYQGNIVPIAFECEGGEEQPDFTYFTGYIDNFAGENFIFDFLQTFRFNTFTGEVVGNDFLTIFPMEGVGDILFYAGEALEPSLSTTQSIYPNFYSGEEANAYLATDSNLDEIDFYTGETFTTILTDNPPAEFLFNFYTGETASGSVSTTARFAPIFYTGETCNVEVTDNPQPDLLFEIREGQTSDISISVSLQLGLINGYTGEWATIASIDNDQFWRFYTGESGEIELATETTIPAVGYTGETVQVVLESRPSEGLGIFRAYAGERGEDLVLNVLTAVLLYPNRISTRTEINCEFDISTSFDLLNTACCPIKDTWERIELTDQPPPDEHYDGDKTIITADLSTLPRFTFNFHAGENFRGIDPNYLGTFNAYEGHIPTINYIDFEFVDFRLCYGNFIPDGDIAFIELISTYDDNCEADFMFAGETAVVEVENNVQLDLNMYTGEYMIFDLHIEPIMLLLAWTGEHVRISNPEFEFRAYTGEVPTFNFYEDTWNFYTGEMMTIGNLTTEYEVEFLEMGCLDNEYVPTNENGDPDWENFNPVPIELEFYRHSIKARCY